MSENRVMYLMRVGNGVVGFALIKGVSMVISMVDASKETTRSIERNFVSRFSAQRIFAVGNGQADGGKHWEFVWLDYNNVIKSNQPDLPLETKKSGKPKIYEIQNKDGGFMVIKHDQELLDEDEVKLKLFAKSVNE